MIQYSAASKNIGVFKNRIEVIEKGLIEQHNWPVILPNHLYVFVLSPKNESHMIISPEFGHFDNMLLQLRNSVINQYGRKDFMVNMDLYNQYRRGGFWAGVRATKNQESIDICAGLCTLLHNVVNNLIIL